MHKFNHLSFGTIFFIFYLFPLPSFAITFPDKPSSTHYFVDQAKLISTSLGNNIDVIATELRAKNSVPLFVVTIESLAKQDASSHSIEQYAAALFNHWGMGRKKDSTGILLLISLSDRKARIELGQGWGRKHDWQAQQIMDNLIIPAFKRKDYAQGITDGVAGLSALANGSQLPRPTVPWWVLPLMIGGFILIIILIVNLFKTGRKGWAWALIAGLGIMVYFILVAMAKNSGSSGGFGGGSSGGGGATGSW